MPTTDDSFSGDGEPANKPMPLIESPTRPLLRNSPRLRAMRTLRRWLQSGKLSSSEPLPPEPELAGRLGISHSTLRRALTALETEGLLRSEGRSRLPTIQSETSSNVTAERGLLEQTVAVLAPFTERPPAYQRSGGWETYTNIALISALHASQMTALTLRIDEINLAYAQQLIKARIKGLIAFRDATVSSLWNVIRENFRQAHIPIVMYANDYDNPGVDSVGSDHEMGAYLLTRWLLQKGCRNILRMNERNWVGNTLGPWVIGRNAGYERACNEAGVAMLPQLDQLSVAVKSGHDADFHNAYVHLSAGYLAAYLREHPAVDSIMAPSDGCVPTIAAALRLLGRKPQVDIKIVGYDNYWQDVPSFQFEPTAPLATVDKRNWQIGEALVQLLNERIQGSLPPENQHRNIEPELVVVNEK